MGGPDKSGQAGLGATSLGLNSDCMQVNRIIFFLMIFIAFSNCHYAQLDTLWSKNYGTETTESMRQVHQTSDGGFIMVGEQLWYNNTDPCQIFLVKVDSIGNEEWRRQYGGYSYDVPYTVTLTSDNGFIIGGETTSYEKKGIFVLRLDSNGDSLWMTILGNETIDHLTNKSAIVETENGDILVTGWGWRPPNANQILLFKLDSTGNEIWEKNYGGNNDDFSSSILTVNSASFLISGFTYSFGLGNTCDGYLIKINAQGDTIWTKTYGGDSYDSFHSVKNTYDNGFIAVGSTQSFGNSEQGYLVKTDYEGNLEWQVDIGDSLIQGLLDVCPSSNHNFVACGYVLHIPSYHEDALLVHLDSDGKIIEQKIFTSKGISGISSIERIFDNNFIGGGLISSTDNDPLDFWLIKFKLDQTTPEPTIPDNPILLQNFPNPFNNGTQIQFILPKPARVVITIFDILGNKVSVIADKEFESGVQSVNFFPNNLSSGVYGYQIIVNEFIETRKMVFIK